MWEKNCSTGMRPFAANSKALRIPAFFAKTFLYQGCSESNHKSIIVNIARSFNTSLPGSVRCLNVNKYVNPHLINFT